MGCARPRPIGRIVKPGRDLLPKDKVTRRHRLSPAAAGECGPERAWDAAREHLVTAQEGLAVKPNPGNTASVRFLEAVHAEDGGHIGLAVDKLRQVQQAGFLQQAGFFMRLRLLRDWVDTAMRMALRGAGHGLAEDLAAQAGAHAEHDPAVPTATGIAAQALGLVKNDPAMLEHSVEMLKSSPRPLVRAAAHTDLGQALLSAGRRPPKREGRI
ncbi:hypothetical protein E0500_005130 [Streptomyces sp. KM273126]|uniref:hypothetical protein n=1 Tax=Streptomyces sp. KM273126 TaxID=2545247 RepID=UPI001039C4C3|nr:hypothetical protein [Streptomyces sp. KM273126]MBA2806851.1 hypothetical protein [Streptomyces sp. KM273126]